MIPQILTIATFVLPQIVFSQMYFANPSFEGPTGTGITPAPWTTCCYTPDTGPGVFGVNLPASDGSTYVGFWDGLPFLGSCPGGAGEGCSQLLPCNLTAGTTYTFDLDLAWDLDGGATYTVGAGLRVFGGNAFCQKGELLWTGSPTVAQVWETKSVTFTPTSNWTHISFFATAGSGSGYVLMDNLGPIIREPLTASSTDASCSGPGNDGSATVDAPVGPAWEYVWSDGQTTPTASNLSPGTYTVTVTDPSESCPIPIYLTFIIDGPPTATVSASPTSICPGETSQLDVTTPPLPPPAPCIYALNLFDSFGDGWSNPGSVALYVGGVLVGNYTCTGASVSIPFTVNQGDAIQVVYTSSSFFNGDNSFQIRDYSNALIYSSPIGPANGTTFNGVADCGYTVAPTYTYSWTNGGSLDDNSIEDPVASPTTTTTYEVTVTDPSNPSCPFVGEVTIDVCIVGLGVELVSFTAQNEGILNGLVWETSFEENNDYFTIETSSGDGNWTTIGTVKGEGDSDSGKLYRLNHYFDKKIINYYRLSQTDINGERTFLKTVLIDNRLVIPKVIQTVNLMGQEVNENYRGMVIDLLEDGTTVKRLQ